MTVLSFAAPVQPLIAEVEERMRSQSDGYHPELYAALNQLLTAGGKRVRPTVTLLVGGMLGVDQDRAITLAAAVELLHTATLVHDDLIDGSLLRRGTPTLNAQWNSAATILAGDFLFSRAASLAAEVDSIPVMKHFSRALSIIVNGEIGQIFSRHTISTRAEYYERIYAKTSSMFELAACAPGYLAKVDDEMGKALNAYGYAIGMAFQLVDDALDFSSDAETMGKPVASDLRLGLVTLPALYYMEHSPQDDRVKQLQRGDELSEDEIDALVDDIRQSGGVQATMDEADAHIQNALQCVQAMPEGEERLALVELADYVVERLH